MSVGVNGKDKELQGKLENPDQSEKTKKYEKYENCFDRYNIYFEPVIIIDSDFIIIYKNMSAKSYIKLQIKKNIRRLINNESIGRFNNAVENAVSCVVDLDIPAPFSRCVANVEEIEYEEENGEKKRKKVFIFIFFASINFAKGDNNYKSSMVELIKEFNNQNISLNQDTQYRLNELKKGVASDTDIDRGNFSRQVKFMTINHKKMMRMQNHFNTYINNIDDKVVYRRERAYCDVGDFFIKLKTGLDKYMRNNGYAMSSPLKTEDTESTAFSGFIAKIHEKDFLMMNVIILTFAFKYAEANTVYQKFSVGSEKKNIIMRYEFNMNEKFIYEYGNNLNSERLAFDENAAGIDKIDLTIALIIAKNNDSVFEVKTNFNIKRAAVELIIDVSDINVMNQGELDFTSEQIQNMLDIEFSEVDF